MLESFLLKPFFAVILVSISCSLLGVFVLWKRLFYFGDAMSHSILLGLAIGSFFAADQILILMCFAIIFALVANFLSQSRYASKGLIVAILSYFCIASAFLIDDIFSTNINFHSYIFGDILAASDLEIQILAAIAIVAIFYSIFALKKILLINLNNDLAKISGIKTEVWNLSFLILLSLTVAVCVQIVGIFLMTALLILPATIARIFSISAKQMMILSLILGVTISSTSFQLASHFDLKASSTIIAFFCVIFFICLVFKKVKL